MQRLAFYAPLKSPDHPVPSGDREMALSIMNALSMNSLGLTVDLASKLRCYDGKGDLQLQRQLKSRADAEVERVLDSARHRNFRAWVTYHNYYKAPDLIGCTVSRKLNIPYLLIEASIARSRLSGPWAEFAALADDATAHANVVFSLTEKDRVALEKHRPDKQKVVPLAPFLNCRDLAPVRHTAPAAKQLLAVGMHRPGDKLASYRIIADMLPYLTTPDWQLSVVGDGPARLDIEALFAPFGERVRFLGQLDRKGVAAAYQRSSVFVWPGVNEAFGMVYLEAQAAGIPVVAQDRPGVREVIASPQSLVPDNDPALMAQVIDTVLADPRRYQSMVASGCDFVRRHHLLDAAAVALSEQLEPLVDL